MEKGQGHAFVGMTLRPHRVAHREVCGCSVDRPDAYNECKIIKLLLWRVLQLRASAATPRDSTGLRLGRKSNHYLESGTFAPSIHDGGVRTD